MVRMQCTTQLQAASWLNLSIWLYYIIISVQLILNENLFDPFGLGPDFVLYFCPLIVFLTGDHVTTVQILSFGFYPAPATFSISLAISPPPIYLYFLSKSSLQPLLFSSFPILFCRFPFFFKFHYWTIMNVLSSSLSINLDLYVLFVGLFSTQEFRNRFELNNLKLKEFLPCEFQADYEPAAKLANIACEKAIQRQGSGMNW